MWELREVPQGMSLLSLSVLFLLLLLLLLQTGGKEPYAQPLQQLEAERAFFMLPQEVLKCGHTRQFTTAAALQLLLLLLLLLVQFCFW